MEEGRRDSGGREEGVWRMGGGSVEDGSGESGGREGEGGEIVEVGRVEME